MRTEVMDHLDEADTWSSNSQNNAVTGRADALSAQEPTRPAFPFAAIVGQDEMKHALLMAAVDPSIGGVLVLGDRGTGKSTAVRGLADLLPEIDVVERCPCNCGPGKRSSTCLPQCIEGKYEGEIRRRVPVVDLPLGATEDRIIGALNLERALAHGERVFEPGLLAMANRGFLYIDEVNLLEDHLVDLLLDAAASGENVVERDGLSVRHPARFVIVGSGNPEEGELRPQLLDRFGLSVEIHTPTDIAQRIEVIRRRDAYERDPAAFAEAWRDAAEAVRDQITAAQARLDEVDMPDHALEIATRLCLALGSDGLRGELSIMKAARATAALDERTTVEPQDIKAVAASALRHRLRRDPLDDTGSTARVERAAREIMADG
jgi:magnesium chelatase subunit I